MAAASGVTPEEVKLKKAEDKIVVLEVPLIRICANYAHVYSFRNQQSSCIIENNIFLACHLSTKVLQIRMFSFVDY